MHVFMVMLLVIAAVSAPAALEITGEHRLMATYDLDAEIRAAEALVVRWGDSWAELVVTKRWSSAWPARFEAELAFWKTSSGWDYGAGVLCVNASLKVYHQRAV